MNIPVASSQSRHRALSDTLSHLRQTSNIVDHGVFKASFSIMMKVQHPMNGGEYFTCQDSTCREAGRAWGDGPDHRRDGGLICRRGLSV
jgi:hypothetical protein